jgi:hypothetical protein
MCQAYPYKALRFLGDRAAVLYSLHNRTLVYNGLEDTTVAIPQFGESGFRDLQTRTARLRGGLALETMFHPGTGHRPYFVTKPVALWMEKRLDFPAWSAQQIETMTTSRISEWAKANAVDMDPLYATEHREGGTPALGSGVPGIPRAQLHVFSETEWQSARENLIHESGAPKPKADRSTGG